MAQAIAAISRSSISIHTSTTPRHWSTRRRIRWIGCWGGNEMRRITLDAPARDIIGGMGEIREKVRLTNMADWLASKAAKRGKRKVRSIEVEGVIDTGAVMSVVPVHVAQKLGIGIRTQRMAKYADGRTESGGVTD